MGKLQKPHPILFLDKEFRFQHPLKMHKMALRARSSGRTARLGGNVTHFDTGEFPTATLDAPNTCATHRSITPWMTIPLQIPTNNCFPWLPSGAGFCPSTVSPPLLPFTSQNLSSFLVAKAIDHCKYGAWLRNQPQAHLRIP